MDHPKKAHIVVIEDNAADVILIRKALDENGFAYAITRFEDGEEALQALCPDTGTPDIVPDLILLDLNLPRSEGMDVLRQIRQSPRLSEVPVAILTSSESPGDVRLSAELGADRYILKPAELDHFYKQVGGGIKELLLESKVRGRIEA
jgi:chemotaxis family two-component system response regulator Rcp1